MSCDYNSVWCVSRDQRANVAQGKKLRALVLAYLLDVSLLDVAVLSAHDWVSNASLVFKKLLLLEGQQL